MDKNINVENCPLVTIGLPFYKDKDFLSFAILSVLNQTYHNWELILVDDGGNDGSIDIAKSFQDPRIRLISDGDNKGLTVRLNEIAEMATGMYIARMDADDIMAVDRIECQVSYLTEHPEIDVVGSSAMIIDKDNRITHSVDYSGFHSKFIHSSILGKKSWFISNPYNPEFKRCQDYELQIRTAPHYHFYNTPKPFLFYRVQEGLSYKKQYAAHKAMKKVYVNYNKYKKSLIWGYRSLLLSCFKLFLYYIADKLGLTSFIEDYRWRNGISTDLLLSDKDLEKSIVDLRHCPI